MIYWVYLINKGKKMTVKFHPNIAYLMIGRGILGASFGSPSGITIYSGMQPNAADIVANWANYNSANASFLAHYSGAVWSQPLDGDSKFCSITTLPPPVLPTNAGQGSWCIVWSKDVSSVELASNILPDDIFIVGEVSTLAQSGIVRFNPDRHFLLGTSKAIADGVISASIV